MKLCMVLLLLLFLVFLWICVESQLLLTRKTVIQLSSLPKEAKGTKILQISDIHHKQMGKNNARLIKRAQRLKPDWIVITGDLISRDMRDFTGTGIFLRNLREICPVYLCMGNHELDLPSEAKQQFERVIQQSGCNLLKDTSVQIGGIRLVGASLDYGIYRDENRRFRNLKRYTADDLREAIGVPKGCTILLAHNPLLFESYVQWGADLVLCGHVHGGAVRLPFIGGLLSPERKFFPKYDKGLYQQGKTQMYVSGGIAKLRLFNPPEVNLLKVE